LTPAQTLILPLAPAPAQARTWNMDSGSGSCVV